MGDNSKDEKIIDSIENSGMVESPDDSDFNKNALMNEVKKDHGTSMNNHSNEYTKLLKHYIKNSKETFKQKLKFKKTFFWISVVILLVSFFFFCGINIYVLIKGIDKININQLSGLASSLVGLLSMYIIIPKIIAKYLFNVQEDKNMAKIVKSIQEYDEEIFRNISMNEGKNADILKYAGEAILDRKGSLGETGGAENQNKSGVS